MESIRDHGMAGLVSGGVDTRDQLRSAPRCGENLTCFEQAFELLTRVVYLPHGAKLDIAPAAARFRSRTPVTYRKPDQRAVVVQERRVTETLCVDRTNLPLQVQPNTWRHALSVSIFCSAESSENNRICGSGLASWTGFAMISMRQRGQKPNFLNKVMCFALWTTVWRPT